MSIQPSKDLAHPPKPPSWRRSLKIVLRNPAAILSHPWTNAATIFATFIAFVITLLNPTWARWLSAIALLVGIVMMAIAMWDEIRKTSIYQSDMIPVPIVVNVSNPANSDKALRSLFQIIEEQDLYRKHEKNLTQYLNIDRLELIFDFPGNIYDGESVIYFLQTTRNRLEKIKNKVPGKIVLYLAYIGPASIGIAVGTLFRTDTIRLFQYQKSSDSYFAPIIINNRRFKENVSELKVFEVDWGAKERDRVTVCIDVSSHKIKRSDESIVGYGDIVYLGALNNGTISPDADWLVYCQEIFTVLNQLQQQGYQEIRLVYSMPVTLGVALGIALLDYWPVLLTNYDSRETTYKDLFCLNQIRYHF